MPDNDNSPIARRREREPGSGSRGLRRGVNRYVEPSLLVLLARHNAHGWELHERLQSIFPLPGNLPDLSTLYRALAELETQGAVISQLVPGDGAGRKVYQLTDIGWDLLAFWQQQFAEEHAGMARLLEHFEQVSPRRPVPRPRLIEGDAS